MPTRACFNNYMKEDQEGSVAVVAEPLSLSVAAPLRLSVAGRLWLVPLSRCFAPLRSSLSLSFALSLSLTRWCYHSLLICQSHYQQAALSL